MPPSLLQTIFPFTIVSVGQPLQAQSVNGVFFPFDKNVSGSIFVSVSKSTTVKSAR
jgi:hypothetical protein